MPTVSRSIHGPALPNEYTKEANYPPIKQYKNSDEEEEVISYIHMILKYVLMVEFGKFRVKVLIPPPPNAIWSVNP